MKITGCLLTCLALSLASIVNADATRTVVFAGDVAPGTSQQFLDFTTFNPGAILNNTGRAAFLAKVPISRPNRVTRVGPHGHWSEGNGELALLALEGRSMVLDNINVRIGLDGLGDPTFIPFSFNDAGHSAFLGFLYDSGGSSRGIWTDRGNELALIVRSGSMAPNTNEIFRGFDKPILNNTGQVAFIGSLLARFPGPYPRGIWSEGKGPLALVALEGNEAPGTQTTFSYLDSFVFNGAGQTAFFGILTPSGVSNTNDRGIWSEGNGSLALIARTGSGSPVIGADFSVLNDPVLNDAGHIAFRGQVTGTGVNQSNDKGIWSDRNDSLALVVRGGTDAPGTDADFFDFDSPVLNGDDKTAFLAILAGPGVNSSNNDGIWSEGGGSLALVAREGSVAPGTEETFLRLDPPSLNSAGQVAFSGYLSGENVNDDNNFGIWAEDPSGGLRLIAREGGQLDVDDGPGSDSRTISRLLFGLLDGSGNEDGRPSFFNDRGQLVFRATFTDGTSGIFVSNLVAIPEPGALVLLGVGSVGLLLGRVRRNRKP